MLKSKVKALALLTAASSTLVCCAIPAMLVLFGAGASLASFFSVFPWAAGLSEHKGFLFTGSGVLILAAIIARISANKRACPIDPLAGQACRELKSSGKSVLWAAAGIWFIGFFFAFVAEHFV